MTGRTAGTETFIVEDQIGFLLRAVAQRNHEVFGRVMIAGLTRGQFPALAKLFEIGSCSQNELGRLVLMDRASIKGVVSRLKKRGYIEIRKDPTDRRQHVLCLTKLGEKTVKRGIAVMPQVSEEMMRGLSSAERSEIVRLLKKIT